MHVPAIRCLRHVHPIVVFHQFEPLSDECAVVCAFASSLVFV